MTRVDAATATLPITDDELTELLNGIGYAVSDVGSGVEWLIPDFIHPGITCVSGQPERGKSTLIYAMVRCLLEGRPWLGRPTRLPSAKRVLIGCEDAAQVRQVRKMFGSRGQVVAFLLARVNESRAARLLQAVTQLEVGLVVIDSVFAFAGNANDQERADLALSALRSLRVPVLVVHHAPKGRGCSPSGAQQFAAAYRHTIGVDKFDAAKYPQVRMTLKITGNDVGGSELGVVVDVGSLEVVEAERPAVKQKPADETIAAKLGEHAARMGIVIGDGEILNATRVADELVGPKDQPNPIGLDRVAAAVGHSLSHQLVRKYLGGTSKGLVLAAYRAEREAAELSRAA